MSPDARPERPATDAGWLAAQLPLAGSGDQPLYLALARALGEAIEEGVLPVGAALPAERALAAELAVSRSTVSSAYDWLRATGLVESRTRSGTRVAPGVARRGSLTDARLERAGGRQIYARLVGGTEAVIPMTLAVRPGDASVRRALEEVLSHDLDALLAQGAHQPGGLPRLRERIAERFAAAGAPTTADQVLVTTGAQQALTLVTQCLLRPGSAVLVERPSWPGCFDLFEAAGAAVHGVPMDEAGVLPDHLDRALREHRPALVFVTPTFHNPTGVMMSRLRRERVVDLCARHGVPLVEDNAYSTRLPGRAAPPPPLAALATRGAEVISVDSLSKSSWAGLRVGWVRASRQTVDRLARHKTLADLGTPVIDQAVALRLLGGPDHDSGHASDHDSDHAVERRAAEAGASLAHLQRELRRRLPGWRWTEPAGGSTLWVQAPGVDTRVLAQVALRHGVEVVPGRVMDPTGAHDDHLRLPFTHEPALLTEAVRRLAEAAAYLAERSSPPSG